MLLRRCILPLIALRRRRVASPRVRRLSVVVSLVLSLRIRWLPAGRRIRRRRALGVWRRGKVRRQTGLRVRRVLGVSVRLLLLLLVLGIAVRLRSRRRRLVLVGVSLLRVGERVGHADGLVDEVSDKFLHDVPACDGDFNSVKAMKGSQTQRLVRLAQVSSQAQATFFRKRRAGF